MKKNELTIYGKIKYDEDKKTLIISNKGKLYLSNFLLGSLKEETRNPELIGKFGEGMKLAILALCRMKKNVIIISTNKKFSFIIKEDSNFFQNNQSQKCLHCKIENFKNNNIDENIEVIIKNINKDEWGENVKNYLWLLEDNIEIYTSIDKYGNEIGQVIYESYLTNKIFVKGIYIQEIEKDDNYKNVFIPGINADLEIDRDRNCIQSYYQLKQIAANIISNIMDKNFNYFKSNKNKSFKKTKYGYEEIKEEDKTNIAKNKNEDASEESEISEKSDISKLENTAFKEFPESIIKILKCENLNFIDSRKLANNLSKKTIELLWKKINSKKEYKGKQPIKSENSYLIDKFIKEHNLPTEFYKYYLVNTNIMNILEKSKNYISIEDKFNKYLNGLNEIIPENKYKEALNEVYSKIKIKKSKFSKNNVIFKDFSQSDKDFCYYYNTKIYFSGSKLKEEINEKWKFWIFIKILNALGIKIENSYEYFKEVFGIKNI